MTPFNQHGNKHGCHYRHRSRLPVGALSIMTALVFLDISGGCVNGMQIVVTTDSVSKLTNGEVGDLLTTTLPPTVTSLVFTVDPSMQIAHLTTEANGWLAADNMTAIVDMTSDCRVTALATVTGIPLLRTSLVSCRNVMPDVSNVRASMEVYVKAGFSFLRAVGSCLARVVLLTEHHAELMQFPQCFKGSAVPLLARMVGAWPLSEEQTNRTVHWLRGVGARNSLHYVVVVGSKDFLNGIADLGWINLLPSTFQWVMVVTAMYPSFSCPSCALRTPVFHHSQQAWSSLPLPFSLDATSVDEVYAWQAIREAHRLMDNPGSQTQLNAVNLTMDVGIVLENDTIEQLGTWSEHEGLQLEGVFQDYFPDPSVIRVAVKESPPFAMFVNDENGTRYEGYAIDVLQEVAKRLSFSFSFTEERPDTFGSRLPNGSWTGIIGGIMDGSVDLAVGPLTVTAEREAVVDFTTPFYEFAGIEILMKEVRQEQNLLFFVTVFSEPMWGAWFGVLLLTGFLLAAFDYFSPFSDRNVAKRAGGGGGGESKADAEKGKEGGGGGEKKQQPEAPHHVDTFDLKEGLWVVTASFTLSGPEVTPRTLSGRILVAGFWFFCSIIMANYTANLAAFLTTSRLTTPITSLQDLASQSEVKYSVVRGSVAMQYFERMAQIESNFYELWKNISNNVQSAGDLGKSELAVWDYPLGDTYVKIWSDIESSGMLSSSEEGLERVLEGNFALIDEAPYLQYVIGKHCALTTIGKQFSTKSYAFALPQGSPLTEQISNSILQLQSETFLEKLKQNWWQSSAVGCETVDESDGLSFYTLGGVFLLAGLGLATGLVLCLLEIAWAWFVKWRRDKKFNMIPPANSRTDLVRGMDMANSFECVSGLEERPSSVHMSSF